MADIFISYSKQQPQPTRTVAAYLESAGYSVWWDTDITAGELFRVVIDQELDAATAVIVIWTTDSVTSDWVISEAEHAARQKKLITLRTKDLDTLRIPKPYNIRHTALVDDRAAILAAVRRIAGISLRAVPKPAITPPAPSPAPQEPYKIRTMPPPQRSRTDENSRRDGTAA